MEKLLNSKKKLVAFAALGGLSAAALTSCSDGPSIEDGKPGTVQEHDYHAPYDTFILVGKVMVPQYHPAEYDLQVRQCDRAGDADADKNGCVTASVEVSEKTYDQFHDGDTIVFGQK